MIDKFFKIMEGKEFLPPHYNLALATVYGAGVGAYVHKYYQVDKDMTLMFVKDVHHYTGFISFSFIRSIGKSAFKNFFTEKQKQLEFINKFKVMGEYDTSHYSQLLQKIKKGEDIRSLYKEVIAFIENTRELNAISWFSLYMDKTFCLNLLSEYAVPISPERIEEIWDDISTSCTLSLDKRRELHILKLISNKMPLEQIADTYGYYFQNYNGYTSPQEVMGYLKEIYGHLSVTEAQKKVDEIEKYETELSKKETEVKNKLYTAEEYELFEYLQLIIKVRDERKDYISSSLSIQFAYYRLVTKNESDSEAVVNFIIPSDFSANGDLVADISKIKSRANGSALLVLSDNTIELDENIDAPQIITNINEKFFKKVDRTQEIKGQVGCPGIVKGKIKIILDARTGILNEGEILVTGMTRPEFVPLMKKAAAIITDEGGITCHAAIVSRELKIPCIVGTKNATKALKDGDMVEVDADKGIVTIIK